jgi:hypothetical protein
MTEPLAKRFQRTLTDAAALADGRPALAPLRALLAERAAALDARLRVAVVGRVCQGKSTLVNALIGRLLTPTDTLELSYSVNHIRYGADPRLTVHFKDESVLVTSVAELEGYAARRDENRDLLASIAYLDVVCDEPYLAGFDLIDTAGLDSAWGDDSAVTLEYLRKSVGDLERETVDAASKADALLVVTTWRGMSSVDEEMLRAFLGPQAGSRSPVTTLCVMTKVEELWQGDAEPFVVARQNRDVLLRNATVRSLLFEVEPVCGKLAETAAIMTEAEAEDLRELVGVPAEPLEVALRSANVFLLDDRGLPLTSTRRGELYKAFTGYGLREATRLLRNDKNLTVTELREQLQEISGITRLRDQLTDHFAHRADLLKIRSVGELTTRADREHGASLGPYDRLALDSVVAMIDTYSRDELGLAELELLQELQTGTFAVSDADRAEILRLIGQHGRSVAARLGLPAGTGLPDLITRAVILHDRWRSEGPALVGRKSADTLVRRCTSLRQHLRAAQTHLENPQ